MFRLNHEKAIADILTYFCPYAVQEKLQLNFHIGEIFFIEEFYKEHELVFSHFIPTARHLIGCILNVYFNHDRLAFATNILRSGELYFTVLSPASFFRR